MAGEEGWRMPFLGLRYLPTGVRDVQKPGERKLQFKLADISQEKDTFFDLLLVLDVIEHVEDAFGFLNGIRPKSGP